MNYTLGFCFSPDFSRVALIRKSKPSWQAGKLNGVGGKLEGNETGQDGIEREFGEETNEKHIRWARFATLVFHDFEKPTVRVLCFGSVATDEALNRMDRVTHTTSENTEERIEVCNVLDVVNTDRPDMLSNLNWLIPMAILALKTPNFSPLDIADGP